MLIYDILFEYKLLLNPLKLLYEIKLYGGELIGILVKIVPSAFALLLIFPVSKLL
jgi:hypothetical protein